MAPDPHSPRPPRCPPRPSRHRWPWALCLLLSALTVCAQTSPETVFLTFVAYRAAPGTAWQTPPLLRSGTDPVPAGQYAFQIVILNPREDMLPNALGLPDDKTWIAVHGAFDLDARAQIVGRDDLENAPLTGFDLTRLPFDQPVWIEKTGVEGWARRGRNLVSPLIDYGCRLKGSSCDPNNPDLNFLSAVLLPDAEIGIPAAQGHPSATGVDVLVRLHRLLPAAARSVSARTTESLWQFWEPGAAPKESGREGRGARSLAALVARTQNDISAMTKGASFQLAGYLTAPDQDHSPLVKHFADLVATLQTAAQSRDDGAAGAAGGSRANGAEPRAGSPTEHGGNGGTGGKPPVDSRSAADLNRMLTIVLTIVVLFLGALTVVMAAWKAAMWWKGRRQDPTPQDGRIGQPAARRSAAGRFDPWAWTRRGALGRHFPIGGGRPPPAHNEQMAAVPHSRDPQVGLGDRVRRGLVQMAAVPHSRDPQGGSSGHDRPRNEPSLGSFDSPPLNSPAPGSGRDTVYEVDSEHRLLAIEQQLKSLAILSEKLQTALKTERDRTERTIVKSIANAIGQLRRDLEENYPDRDEVRDLPGKRTTALEASLAALGARVQSHLDLPEPDLGRLLRDQIEHLLPDLDDRIDSRTLATEERCIRSAESAVTALRAEVATKLERLRETAAPMADLVARLDRIESDLADQRIGTLARAVETLAAELHGEGSPLRVGTWKRREVRELLERQGRFDADAWDRLWADDPDTEQAVSRLVLYHIDARALDAAQAAAFAAWVEQVSRGRLGLVRPMPMERFDERLHHSVAVAPGFNRLGLVAEVHCFGLMDAETVRLKARVTVTG